MLYYFYSQPFVSEDVLESFVHPVCEPWIFLSRDQSTVYTVSQSCDTYVIQRTVCTNRTSLFQKTFLVHNCGNSASTQPR